MYAEHFGFSKFPFSVTPDPQLFFNNSAYREASAKLQHCVLAKKGLILLTGELGTGKTTLLGKFLNSLGPSIHSVLVLNTHGGFLELLRFILDDLNLAGQHDNKPAMIETLNRYLLDRSRQGHIVTVVIDEAQNLSDEELEGLRLLSRLKTGTEKLLQIVLIGQPQLESRLDQPKLRPLKQRITIQCRLAPLKKEEVAAYIEFRLNAVDFRGQSPFQRDALEAIASYSKGIPRLINIICDNALLAAYGAAKPAVSAQMIQEVARDLQLEPARSIKPHAANRQIRIEPRTGREHRPEIKSALTNTRKEHRQELQQKRSLTGLAVGIFLGTVFLAGIAVSYSQQSKIYFSDLSTKWEDFSRGGRNYFSNSTVKVREAVRTRWQNLKQVKPAANSTNLADSGDVNPSKRTQPAEKLPAISQESQEPKQVNSVPPPVEITPAEVQRAENTGPATASGTDSDNSNAQQADSQQLTSLKPEPPPLEGPSEEQTPYLGNFEVTANSFVRDTPQSDAAIITTLKPGSLVRIEGKTGKYFDVRSLDGPRIHGYVHQEDAFFKHVK